MCIPGVFLIIMVNFLTAGRVSNNSGYLHTRFKRYVNKRELKPYSGPDGCSQARIPNRCLARRFLSLINISVNMSV